MPMVSKYLRLKGLINMDCQDCDEDNDVTCEDCCDHSDCDEHCCLICGKDMTEDFAARAYDRYKDYMKYGE